MADASLLLSAELTDWLTMQLNESSASVGKGACPGNAIDGVKICEHMGEIVTVPMDSSNIDTVKEHLCNELRKDRRAYLDNMATMGLVRVGGAPFVVRQRDIADGNIKFTWLCFEGFSDKETVAV